MLHHCAPCPEHQRSQIVLTSLVIRHDASLHIFQALMLNMQDPNNKEQRKHEHSFQANRERERCGDQAQDVERRRRTLSTQPVRGGQTLNRL